MATPGPVALITGAARGIGSATAELFRRRGWQVMAGDIDSDGLARTADASGAMARPVDVGDPASVRDLVAATVSAFGRIDVAVNNAGLVHVAGVLDHDLSTWRRLFTVNVEGPLNVMQAAVPVMREQTAIGGCRGRIINVSSPAADRPRPLLPGYGASKAALNHLSRTAAVALEPLGVWVTVVYPTSVADGMWAQLPGELAAVSSRTDAEVIQERLDDTPTGSFQPASEVAEMIFYAATAREVNRRLLWTEAHFVDL